MATTIIEIIVTRIQCTNYIVQRSRNDVLRLFSHRQSHIISVDQRNLATPSKRPKIGQIRTLRMTEIHDIKSFKDSVKFKERR